MHLIGSNGINVFHHKIPDGHAGVERCAFEQLYYKRVRRADAFVGEFTYLINSCVANHIILIGNGQRLVAIEGGVERKKSQLAVEAIFILRKLPRTFHFNEIHSGIIIKRRPLEQCRNGVDIPYLRFVLQ